MNNIFGIFNECNKLASLPDISKWNANKVTDKKTIFQFSSSLTQKPDN